MDRRRWFLAALACAAWVGLAAAGCDRDDTPAGDDDTGDDDTGDDDTGDDDAGDDDDTGDDDAGDDDTSGPPWQAMCDRWNADRADMSEGGWTGDVGTCDAGDMTGAGRDNALRLINLYRDLAGLPPVATDPGRDASSQECALMMDAANDLDHYPDPSWPCYTADGASAAGSSCIASGPAVTAVDMYMADWGNTTTMGHRRWILSNGLGPVGIGSTTSYSCLWVIGGSGSGGNDWTAFPTPGYFPIQAMDTGYVSVDDTGWTVQSDSIDLAQAQVTVTSGGAPRPVSVVQLLGGYGSTDAINILPDGWTAQAGETYHVSVSGTSPPIEYDVQMVDCGS